MTGREEEAAEFGRDVGVEVGRAAADFAGLTYRFARKARWLDGAVLVVLLLVLPCFGVWWPWPTAWFVVSFLLDLLTCWKLNPKRRRKAQS